MSERVPTVPERIAGRRLRKTLRRARVAGATGGSLAALLAGVAFAVAEDPAAPPAAAQDARCPVDGVPSMADAAVAAGITQAELEALCAPGAPPAAPAPDPASAAAAPTADAPASSAAAPASDTRAPEATAPPAATDPATPPAPSAAAPDAAAAAPGVAPAAPAPAPASAPAVAPAPAVTPAPAATAPARRAPKPDDGTVVVDTSYEVAPIRVTIRRPAKRRPAAPPRPAATPRRPAVNRTPAAAPREVREITAPALTGGPDGVAPASATPDQIVPTASAAAIAWSGLSGFDAPLMPSGAASRFDGPRALLPIYMAAALQYDVPWELLAAINDVETSYGSNVAVSSAGAVGWMQFMPATWATYGVDGDGDEIKDPDDPVDAIFAAARYLKASGAPDDLRRAVFAYNRSNDYVSDVLGRASKLAAIPPEVLATLTSAGLRDAVEARGRKGGQGLLEPDAPVKSLGRIALLPDAALAERVLEDADVSGCQAEDIRTGAVDRRLLVLLATLAYDDLRPAVSSLRCGRAGRLTSSGNVSQHTTGDAVDIPAINGVSMLGRQGPGSDAAKVVRRAAKLPGAYAADQIISLMTLDGADNTIAMADHDDHVHVGFTPEPTARPAEDAGPGLDAASK